MRPTLTIFAAALLGISATAQDAADVKPYEKADDTWISIDGTVDTVSTDAFVLDYGEGLITVEMDDGDRDADGYKLDVGEKVRVSGMVDDDFFEARTIEASSVYIEEEGTYFYASAIDEEDNFLTYSTPVTVADSVIQGTVTAVEEEEFALNTGLRLINVEVDEMAYNPLDDIGYQQIEVGDRVSVTGRMDTDIFEAEREFVAESVITLSDMDG
jgi:uncharacterized protein YdeI (BOF family)